jgi:hypothetical protein
MRVGYCSSDLTGNDLLARTVQRALAAFWWQCVSKPPLVSDAIGGFYFDRGPRVSYMAIKKLAPESQSLHS